jgi:hypothetical protein
MRYSVARVGSPGWRWLVWEGRSYWVDETDMRGTGMEPTREAAEAAARAVGGQQPAAPGVAADWHRRLAREQARQRRSSATGSATIEYVYRAHECYDACYDWGCSQEAIAHQVIKKTARSIFVLGAQELSWDRDGQQTCDISTFKLDRAALERGETVRRPGRLNFSGRYAASPDAFKRTTSSEPPACITALGLAWPTTEDEVRRSYRRLALERHPDVGGEHAAFVELGRHYETALTVVRRAVS